MIYSPQTILVFLPYPFLRTCGKKEHENRYKEWERRLWFTTTEGENVYNQLLIVDGCLQLNEVQLRNTSPRLFLLLLDGSMCSFPSL